MGVRIASSGNNTPLGSPIVTTAETVIATTGPIGLATDNAQVVLLWTFSIAVSANATSITIRLRRGNTVTSTVVNNPTATSIIAAAGNLQSGNYTDQPGVASGLQYSLTVAIAGATANSTVNDVSLTAIVL